MARMNRASHGTTGFLTTLVLTCAFADRRVGALDRPTCGTAIATGENAALPVAVAVR